MSTTTSRPEATPVQPETSTGLDANIAAALAYLLGWLTGIVFYLVEGDNEYVRFHAAQSIVVFGGLTVVWLVIGLIQGIVSSLLFVGDPGTAVAFGLVGLFFGLVNLVLWLAGLVVWLYLMVRTYQEQNPRLPVAAGIADRIA